jgi:hypothetical protein
VFGPGKDQLLFKANLERAIGPVREVNAYSDPGDWVFTGTFKGKTVRAGIVGSKGTFSGVRYAAPISGPVRFHVEGHYATYTHAAHVPTGDPEFDQLYKVHGLPPEIVLAALDAPMRRWYIDTYGDKSPQTDSGNGWLSLYKTYRRTMDTFDLPDSDVPMPEEIAHFFDVAIGLADRMSQGYEARRAEIAQTHGPAAAEQWHASYVGTMQDAERRRQQQRKLLIAIVLAVVAFPVVITVVIIAFMILGSIVAVWR